MRPSLASLLPLLLLLGPARVSALPDPVISVQGRAVIGGNAPSGTVQMKFAIGDATGAQTYWRNDGQALAGEPPDASAVTVPVDNGVFRVLLGDESMTNMASLDPAVLDQPEAFLRIWLSDGGPYERLLPDQRLAATPYAVVAHAVADAAVGTDQLADGAVTRDKLQNGAVDSAALANNAVQSFAIAFGAVTGDKISADAVTADSLAEGAVDQAALADDAVGSAEVIDGGIGAGDLADGAVTSVKLAPFAVGSGQLGNGSVTTAKLAPGAVDHNALAANAVDTAQLRDLSVTTPKLADAAVTSAKLADESVDFSKLTAGAVPDALQELGLSALPAGTLVLSTTADDPALLGQGFVARGAAASASASFDFKDIDVGNRRYNTVVWAGSTAIFWGGSDFLVGSPVGAAAPQNFHYYPGSDSVTTLPTTNEPSDRFLHTAVWTGDQMVVWGGADLATGAALNTGGRYKNFMSWTATDTAGADLPSARCAHAAVIVGDEMAVWGGRNQFDLAGAAFRDDGGLYDWVNDSWRPLPAVPGGFAARSDVAAATDGSRLFLFGGRGGTGGATLFGDGLVCDIAGGGGWSALPLGPAVRQGAEMAYLDGRLVLAGGRDAAGLTLDEVWILDLGAGTWQQVTNPVDGIFRPQFLLRRDARTVVVGGSNTDVYTLDLPSLNWTLHPRPKALAPGALGDSAHAAWTGDSILYAVHGGSGPRGYHFRLPSAPHYLYEAP